MKRGKFFLRNKKNFSVLFGILFVFLFILFPKPILSETQTNISVKNTPPILQQYIPDQNWPEEIYNLNAFDLDNYFIDPNGDNITYNSSPVDKIQVLIDPITNIVSFYQDSGFIGERIVTFYALDDSGNGSSNPVTLRVGLDNESPNWSSPAKSKGDVYQNDYVNFTSFWVDNVQLQNYILSVNQGVAGWTNYSSVNFSGISNTSIFEVQISAPADQIVKWMFYAWDTSGNMNVTENQSFIVLAYTSGTSAPPPDDEESGTGITKAIKQVVEDLDLIPKRKLKDFKLNVFDYKISLKQGTSRTVVLKITNVGTEDLSLSVKDAGLLDFVIFSEKSFELLPGNSKEITIDFRVPRSAYPGQYFGFINVIGTEVNKTVPVVLDVQAVELDYDILLNITEEYKTVKPGNRVFADIHVYNVKDLFQTNATLYYALKDYNGSIYAFEEEGINFSTSFIANKSLLVPEGTEKGKYIFYAMISDKENIAIDSDFFFVGESFTLSAFFRSNSVFFLIFFLSVFLAIFMTKYQKDRRKERILHLYIMLTKLKNLIKQEKTQEALELFLRIRIQYKEPLNKEILQDKQRLKQEMLKLYEIINPEALKRIQEQEKQQEQTNENPSSYQVSQKKENLQKNQTPKNQEKDPVIKTSPKINPKQVPNSNPKSLNKSNSQSNPSLVTREIPKQINSVKQPLIKKFPLESANIKTKPLIKKVLKNPLIVENEIKLKKEDNE